MSKHLELIFDNLQIFNKKFYFPFHLGLIFWSLTKALIIASFVWSN